MNINTSLPGKCHDTHLDKTKYKKTSAINLWSFYYREHKTIDPYSQNSMWMIWPQSLKLMSGLKSSTSSHQVFRFPLSKCKVDQYFCHSLTRFGEKTIDNDWLITIYRHNTWVTWSPLGPSASYFLSRRWEVATSSRRTPPLLHPGPFAHLLKWP